MKPHFHAALALLMVFCSSLAMAQSRTVIKGVVTDKKNNEPLPFVTVLFVGTSQGTTTDFEGKYVLETENSTYKKVKFSSLGYKSTVKDIVPGQEQVINIRLEAEARQLDGVEVKARNQRYRNKDNPAVELIRKVIDHKEQNRSTGFSYYEFERYEKIQFALSNVSEKFKNRKVFRKFQFVFENMDTTKLPGKPVLPVYMKEELANVYYRKNPEKRKEIVKARKMVSFEGYVDNQGLDNYIKYLYQDINIYDNNIMMLTNQFLSPIAGTSPVFYKFFILDTLEERGQKLIELAFVPRNHNDFLFQGKLYITLDSNYAVAKVDMSVNKSINLNWVKELKVLQEFAQDSTHKFVLTKDEFMADFGISKGTMGLFGERSVSYRNTRVNYIRPDSIYDGDTQVTEVAADSLNEAYWQQHRHEALTASEQNIYTTIDSVKKVPVFKRSMDIAVLLLAGYKSFGWFEVGPVNTFYSFNPVEGFRLRAGGRTTPKFSKRINFETYGAYGFKDEKWKYYFGTTYSLTKRSIYEFPVRSLKLSYQHDMKIPGQELLFVQEDNFLLSFKRGVNDKWLYNDFVNFEYLNEYKNHFSFTLGMKYWFQQAAGGLHYNRVNYNDPSQDINGLTTTEFSVQLRWAPNEKFYQGKNYRIPIFNGAPIFSLKYVQGVKGVFGSEYNYQNISLNIYKRFYLSQLGYTDIVLEGGMVVGKVPFPLLDVHRANQTYSYQLLSYNLMNFLEFVSDHYVSLNVDHYFNGFIFNKIPLLKKLKLREVVTGKVLYGNLRSENDPNHNPDLYRFPTDASGIPTTYTLAREPYVEASVGVANIFKFFRVDLVKRFTYLDHPGISQLGIRARFKFDF